jgi:lipoprotein-anchoring transpeptidase ErfK/SrfK
VQSVKTEAIPELDLKSASAPAADIGQCFRSRAVNVNRALGRIWHFPDIVVSSEETAAMCKVRLVSICLTVVVLGGCAHSSHHAASQVNWTQRDRVLLADPPYGRVQIPDQYKRKLVRYDAREAPGTITVDTDNRYLFLILPQGQALRYGITVGEQGLAWSGVAKIGRMEEWPSWVPTPEIKRRLGNLPDYVGPGPQNPMGARALYLYEGNKDTLYRIHGTNQPEYIGHAISSGCIRMTNEDAIDLYNRVKIGTLVKVIGPGHPTRSASLPRPTPPLSLRLTAAR